MLLYLNTFWLCLTPFPDRRVMFRVSINSCCHSSPLLPNKSPRGRPQATWGSIIYVIVFTDELPRWNELCSQFFFSIIGFYVPEGMCSWACFIRNISIGKEETEFLLHPAGSWHWEIRYIGWRAETVCTIAAYGFSGLKEKSWSLQGWCGSIFISH